MTNLLFDYDGTLHDCLEIYEPAVRQAYDRLVDLHLALPRQWTREEVRTWIGLSPDEMWDLAAPGLPPEEKQRSIALVGARMDELIRSGAARLYPGVPQLLDALRQDGFRLLLLSNCPRRYLDAHEKAFGLSRYFDGLYCGEQFGYRPKYEIFRELRAQYEGEFLVIGDRAQDMEIAAKNGIRSIGCLYGYGREGELAGADWLLGEPMELRELMQNIHQFR